MGVLICMYRQRGKNVKHNPGLFTGYTPPPHVLYANNTFCTSLQIPTLSILPF